MTRLLIFLLVAAMSLIASCASTQTGKSIADRQEEYCATADPLRRAVLLSIIQSQVPAYPERGLCTDSGHVLAEAMERQLQSVTIDVDAAAEDQRRFQEKRDAHRDTAPAADAQSPE